MCIHEDNAAAVTVALGYYSMPGVPTLTITAAQIASGGREMCKLVRSLPWEPAPLIPAAI